MPAASKTKATKTRLLLFIGLGLSAFFLWLILNQITQGDVFHDLMEHARVWLALPFLLAYALFFWLKALRWQVLLRPVTRVSVRQIFPSVIIGYAGNLLFPMQFGEILRTYVLGNRLRINNSPIITMIALERMFDFLVIALFLELFLATTSQKEFPSLQLLSYIAGAATLGMFAVLMLYLYRTRDFLRYCRLATGFLPARLHDYLLLQAERGALGLESFRSPRMLLTVMLTSVAMWSAMALATHIAIQALRIDAPLSAAVVTLIFTVIGFMLPSSPGYVGTVQLSFLLALTPYDIASETAVAASIFYHVLISLPPLAVALLACLHLGYTPRRLWRLANPKVVDEPT